MISPFSWDVKVYIILRWDSSSYVDQPGYRLALFHVINSLDNHSNVLWYNANSFSHLIWVSLSFLTFVHSRQFRLSTAVKNDNDAQIKVNYLFKISNGNIRTMCKISTKLTTKTPERRYWHCSNVFYCYLRT